MGGGKHERKMKTGGQGFRGYWIPCGLKNLTQSTHVLGNVCRRAVLLIMTFKVWIIPQNLRNPYNTCNQYLKIPAVYTHNFNRDLRKEWLREQIFWGQMGTHRLILLHYLTVVFWHCGNSSSRIRMERVSSFTSVWSLLLRESKGSQIKRLLMLNPRNRHKKKLLLHKHAYPYNNSCSPETPIQMKRN